MLYLQANEKRVGILLFRIGCLCVPLKEMTGRKKNCLLVKRVKTDLLGAENSRLLQFTKCSGKHIFKVKEKSGNSSLGISKKSQGNVEKHQKYSKASKGGRNI